MSYMKGQGPVYISISGGKGGTGKSVTAVNLAYQLARKGVRVGLIDADLHSSSIPRLLGIDREPVMEGGLFRPVEFAGLQIMSAGILRQSSRPVYMSEEEGRVFLNLFFNQTDWRNVDCFLVDQPSGSGIGVANGEGQPGVWKDLLVTTPNEEVAESVYRAGIYGISKGHDLLGIIENMAYIKCPCCDETYNPFGTEGGQQLADALNCSLLARMPIETLDFHGPAPGIYSESSVNGRTYRYLAEEVLDRVLGRSVQKSG